jgi:hypothetical protein
MDEKKIEEWPVDYASVLVSCPDGTTVVIEVAGGTMVHEIDAVDPLVPHSLTLHFKTPALFTTVEMKL